MERILVQNYIYSKRFKNEKHADAVFQRKRKNKLNLLITDNIVKFHLQLDPQMKKIN